MSALRARRRGTPRDGFLLVEAMAALVLGALILAGLLSLTGLLRRSADRAAWGVEVSEVSERTVDTIAREVRRIARRRWAAPPLAQGARQARPSSQATRLGAPSNAAQAQQANAQAGQANGAEGAAETPAAPPRPFVFSGGPDRMTFTLMLRRDTGLRAPQFVAYQIEEGGAVLRSEAPLPADATQPAAIQLGPVERIDPGPERLRFAYVERLSTGGEAIRDAWADPLKMPAAIRIDRFDARTGQPTGSLRVPLLVDAEAGCASDRGLCSRVEGGAAGGGGADNGASRDPRAPDASGEQQ